MNRSPSSSPIAPSLPLIRCSAEVDDAKNTGKAIVALESTISSTLGLPVPHNRAVVERCVAAIRSFGAVPAITCVLDGVGRVGIEDDELERVLNGTRKCGERDLPVAIALGWDVGVTTVSASVTLSAAAGVKVFATGGIGGVHRDDHLTGDVSADIGAIARHPVVTVTAGAKAFLDLAKTLELFDTLSVPVLGWRTDDFPAFYTRSSGHAVQHRVDEASQIASIFATRQQLSPGGVLVANPIPHEAALDRDEIEAAVGDALREATNNGVRGAALTPFVLGKIAEVTSGRSIPANLALAENNARVAAEISVALSVADSRTA